MHVLRRFRNATGLSLIELMIALAIMSVGMLGFVGAFSYISQSITNARARTIASNLAQEKQEALKKISYYRLVVTTAPNYATENGLGSFPYDDTYYPSETITVAGTRFIRRVYVEKVQEVSGKFASVGATDPDTGMKKLTVYVAWLSGVTFKKQEVRSLYSNPNRQPLGSYVDGNVTDGVNPLQGVRVECLQNTSLAGISNGIGDYGFDVTPGTYTLRAAKFGYYTAYSSQFYVASASTATRNIALTKIGLGIASGRVWTNDHLVISKVVGSTVSDSGYDQEYVEAFNPTTWTWTASDIGLKYQGGTDMVVRTIDLSYVNFTVPAGGYFLFANTTTVLAGGAAVAADAVWTSTNSTLDFPYFMSDRNILRTKDQGSSQAVGALRLFEISSGLTLDEVGWDRNGGGQTAPFYETDGIDQNNGLEKREQYVRKASTAGVSAVYGPAYDSGDNNIDFAVESDIATPPNNSVGSLPGVIAGTPATGAVISADDGLSMPTTAQQQLGGGGEPYAEFHLVNIATGTYNLSVSKGSDFEEIAGVVVIAGATTYVPDGSTTPSWPAAGYHDVMLSSESTLGYITGMVADVFSNVLGTKDVEAGGTTVTTAPDGAYTIPVEAGIYNVAANPASGPNYDGNYVTLTKANVVVSAGEITSATDFLLSQGGSLSGFVTTNGTDPLPNVVVIASQGGIEKGSALSESDGVFSIVNLSTGDYAVVPQLDRGETVSPSSPTATVLLGADTFVDSFTVTGAFGVISGNLTDGSDLIQTGVLLVATTGTISAAPPNDNASLRSGSVLYYASSSRADGTYEIDVRGATGGTNYNIYAWYTTWNGSVPSTVEKTSTATVLAGGTAPVDFAW